MTRPFCACAFLLGMTLPAFADASADKPTDVLARIALISDLHVQRSTNDELAAVHARFHKAIADINAARVDLVLAGGDLTEYGRPDDFAALRRHLLEFDAPVWCVPGNHDVGNKLTAGKTTANDVNAWRVRFYESRVGRSFFARTRAGVRVIGINAPLLGSGLPREQKMWAMLEKELARPAEGPTILLTHYPPLYKTLDEPGDEYWNIEPGPRKRLFSLLLSGGVKTVLSGHLHVQRVNRVQGILFVTTPPISFGLPKGRQPEGWMLITVPRAGEVQVEFRRIAQGTPR